MFAEERRKIILTMLTRDGRVEVMKLANRFQVSEDTIRRDLRELAALGFLQKTHGGAVALDVPSLAWEARSQVLPAAKEKIGVMAAGLIEPNQTVILDAGSTVLELARHLAVRPIKVITNGLDIANLLEAQAGVSLVLVGGEWDTANRYLSGTQAVQAIAEYRADWLFLGTCALHPQAGITSKHAPDAALKRAMRGSALKTVLLADHTKFNQVAPYFVAPLSALHAVVTDRAVDWLRDAGLELLVTNGPEVN
jgi:DeoR/GlpR family transcriptional regulator of sugar metabolism